MNIYFAGSIRGGREDAPVYTELIAHLKTYGTVLTEHVGDDSLTLKGETGKSDQYIHDRDMEWLSQSDAVIAEVTTPSHGVGYEIAMAENRGLPVLCLYRQRPGSRISAMLSGSGRLVCKAYQSMDEAKEEIEKFLGQIKSR